MMSASHDMKNLIIAADVFNLGNVATGIVFQFADLDVRFHRRGESLGRMLDMFSCPWTTVRYDCDAYFEMIVRINFPWTTVRHDSDEYFDSVEASIRIAPLTLLKDIKLKDGVFKQKLLQDCPRTVFLSLLDAVAFYLIKRPRASQCLISYVQSRDYVEETSWKNIIRERDT